MIDNTRKIVDVMKLDDKIFAVKNNFGKWAMFDSNKKQLTYHSYDVIEKVIALKDLYFLTIDSTDGGVLATADNMGNIVVPFSDDWADVIHQTFVMFGSSK